MWQPFGDSRFRTDAFLRSMSSTGKEAGATTHSWGAEELASLKKFVANHTDRASGLTKWPEGDASVTKMEGDLSHFTVEEARSMWESQSKNGASVELSSNVDKVPHRINPNSEWEEPLEMDGFTLWDIYRPPRKVSDDQAGNAVEIEGRSLNSEFKCPICLGILRETRTVMQCLHRFCSVCIERCLRMNANECPACRTYVPSRRSLRADKNFDDLIQKVYPDIDAYEESESKRIDKLNRARIENQAHTDAQRKGLANQMETRHRLHGRHSRRNNDSPYRGLTSKESSEQAPAANLFASRPRREQSLSNPSSSASREEGASAVNKTVGAKRVRPGDDGTQYNQTKKANIGKSNKTEEMWFALRRASGESELSNLQYQWLRTSPFVTVGILKKYLGMKLNIFHHEAAIFIAKEHSATGMDESLRDNMTVHKLKEIHCSTQGDTNLILSYRKISLR